MKAECLWAIVSTLFFKYYGESLEVLMQGSDMI